MEPRKFWSFLMARFSATFFSKKEREIREAKRAYSSAKKDKHEATARGREVEGWVAIHSKYREDLFAEKMRQAFRSTEGYSNDL